MIVSGRRDTFRLIADCRKPEDKVIWFHCASLGEFEQARPVMEAIKNRFEGYRIYLSFFSSSGYEVRKDYALAACVFYLPADTPANAARMLQLIRPQLVIFIKYEFWYYHLEACHRRRIPLVSISTILRPNQVIFSLFGRVFREMLSFFNFFYVQNVQTKKLLAEIGIDQAMVTGDTRFDRVQAICQENKQIPELDDFGKGKKLIILGSTWRPDIDLWKDFIDHSGDNIKFVIAPHHIDEPEIDHISKQLSSGSVRFSSYQLSGHQVEKVLIIDNIGMLSSVYAYGYLIFVGGSFSKGLHNILEPAVYGKPVIIGKSKSNLKYQEAVELVRMGGVFVVKGPEELRIIAGQLLEDVTFYEKTSRASSDYVKQNTGATEKITNSLSDFLD